MKILIVGGVAGGASAAARLRRLNEKAEIILFEKGKYISFANCGLPYYIGGTIKDQKALTLQTKESFYNRFRIDVRLEHEVLKIHENTKEIEVCDLNTGTVFTESYDKLILSPGASPVRPPLQGMDNPKVFTLRNIPDTLKIKEFIETTHPKSVAVVGGGYIGIEMAENLHNAGLQVTVVELSDHVIAPLDRDMAADVQNYMEAKGIALKLKKGVQSISEEASHLTVHLGDEDLLTDFVILSVGVRPDTKITEGTSILKNQKGAIQVNAQMETSVPDIYAVGDAVEIEEFITKEAAVIPLAGPANKEGRIVADVISGCNHFYTGTQGSAILKLFDMTVATSGLNESTLKAKKIPYDKVFAFSASHATYYPGAHSMSIKVLYHKENHQILGAQIVGFEGVDKRMDVLATAMRYRGKVTDLKDLELCYAPPFGSAKDPINMVGFIAENVISGKMKQFFPEDVKNLPCNGSITKLDVRTKQEYESGSIEGFMNIPLDELREHLDQIPKDKPVYIHCRSGLRSYIGLCILQGNGYDCYNMAGGYRLYESMEQQNSL